MNQKTRDMINSEATKRSSYKSAWYYDNFNDGAEYGYALAIEQAQVLVEAMIDMRSECTMPNPTSTPEYVIDRVCEALASYKELTEGE